MVQQQLVLPNFIIIGAGRSGTTSLYYYLVQHPDIFLKPDKQPEPHFFIREKEYVNGLDYYSQTHFSDYQDEKAIGEASTLTLFFERGAQRLYQHLPEIKILCSLRNPIDRMFSEYWRRIDHTWEDLSFEAALEQEAERLKAPKDSYFRDFEPEAYQRRGYYYQHLKAWLKYFPQEQLKVFLFEDLVNDPKGLLKSIFEFLKVDPEFAPMFRESAKNESSHAKHQMLPETRKSLVELYKDENERLAKLIGRDLSSWNQ